MPQQPIFLDDNGEPIKQSAPSPVFLDDSGNEIGAKPAAPGKSVGGFASNTLDSAINFGGNIAQGLGTLWKLGLFGGLDPIATMREGKHVIDPGVKGLANAAMSPIQTGKAIGAHVKDRYGSLDAIGESLYKDPFGVASDISTVAGAGAMLKGAGVAGKVGRAASAVSRATDPVQWAARAGNTVAQRAAPMMNTLGEHATFRAFKLDPAITAKKPDLNLPAVIHERGIRPTEEGLLQLDQTIDPLKARQNQLVDQSDLRVLVDQIIPQLDDYIDHRAGLTGSNPAKLRQGQRVRDDLLNAERTTEPNMVQRQQPSGLFDDRGNPIMQDVMVQEGRRPTPVDMRTLQDLKEDFYMDTGKQWGRNMNTPAGTVEAKMAAAGDFRDFLADNVPGVRGVNAELRPLYALREQMISRTLKTPQHESLLPNAAMAGASAAAGNPGRGAAAALTAVASRGQRTNALVGRNLAAGSQALERGARDAVTTAPLATRLGALQALGEQLQQLQSQRMALRSSNNPDAHMQLLALGEQEKKLVEQLQALGLN